MAELLYIQATTLQEIIDAIEASGYVTVRIQVSPSNADGYIIAKKLLKKIADEVRAFDGTIAEILIKELAERILCQKVIKLATPVIALYDENGIITPSYNTTAILGKAILGYAILGNSDNGNIQKLATPVIYLVDEDAQTVIKLATPVIEIYDDSVEGEPIIEKLATPVIYIYDDTEGEPEVTVVQLATPVIGLYNDTVEEPEEPDEPTIIKLATPVIALYNDSIEKMPFDNSGYIDANGNIVNKVSSGKRYSNIVAISDLANGTDGYCVQDFDTGFTEYPKVLFFSEPSLSSFLTGFTVTEIGSKDTLTVEEIRSLAATVPGAKYVAFNSDFEDEGAEDYAYIVKGAQTFKPEAPFVPEFIKLATPIIELCMDGTNEPDIPVDPGIPTTIQLPTPIIRLEESGDGDSDDNGSGGSTGSGGGVKPPTPGGDVTEDQMRLATYIS